MSYNYTFMIFCLFFYQSVMKIDLDGYFFSALLRKWRVESDKFTENKGKEGFENNKKEFMPQGLVTGGVGALWEVGILGIFQAPSLNFQLSHFLKGKPLAFYL